MATKIGDRDLIKIIKGGTEYKQPLVGRKIRESDIKSGAVFYDAWHINGFSGAHGICVDRGAERDPDFSRNPEYQICGVITGYLYDSYGDTIDSKVNTYYMMIPTGKYEAGATDTIYSKADNFLLGGGINTPYINDYAVFSLLLFFRREAKLWRALKDL